ncbi:MAG: class I SAM-dependent RNA methyltransferase [Acidobacteria bacterium]|nr:class I SAM-dependent RNA methyltransferase [Acidobacteriota bacterium]
MDTTQTNARKRTVTFEKLVYGGDGLARDHGHVILTPFVLPGETAQIEITGKQSQLLRARLKQVAEASPNRVPAPCPAFTNCGGCHYQHIAYSQQLVEKQLILREALTRVGKIEAPEEIHVIAGPEWGYRNRAQFHLEEGRIGYHEGGSRRLCAIEQCAILSPKLQEALSGLRRMSGDRRFPRFLQTVELFTNETNLQLNVLSSAKPVARRFFDWCAAELPGFLDGPLDYTAAGHTFRVSHGAFFQVNRFLVDALVEEALCLAEGESALDLYSGAGLFTLPLAKRLARVSAVESGVAAWRDLQKNAESAGVSIDALQTSAEGYLESNGAGCDFVLADPPRAGLGKKVVERLLERKPRRLTIVSCDPATLARDLAMLLKQYRLTRMTMVDLFPQTYHIETVAHLEIME